MAMLRAKGKLSVEPTKGRIVLNVSNDFVLYYAQFLTKRYWIHMNTPMHGSHVTIYNSRFHTKTNWRKALWYHNKEIEFEYDINMIEGGFNKGFIMFYMLINSPELEDFKKKIGIVDNDRYKGLHLTICSAGKSGAAYANWWPKTIELRDETIRTKA